MVKVAVILSGCGVYDGAEIHESVITLLALDRAGADVKCFAPDVNYMHVINHISGAVVENETRNVLIESARIVRGEIKDLGKANPLDFDAAIFPGGFGVAKNLCDFAVNGVNCTVNPEVKRFVLEAFSAGKPMGFMCIAPALLSKIFEGRNIDLKVTIGSDPETASAIEKMGARHIVYSVDNCLVDVENKIVTTPAYMSAKKISEAAAGIEKLVKEVIALTGK